MASRMVFIRCRCFSDSIFPIQLGFVAPIRSSTAPNAAPITMARMMVLMAQPSLLYIIMETGIAARNAPAAKT